MRNSRRAAAFVIAAWIRTKEFPANLLPSGPDRAFVQDLVYTTVRRFRPLRRVLGEFVKTWPKGELEALLYVGAAQLLYMDEVPDFAAVNETVEAAKECPNPNVAKVVNGVLRKPGPSARGGRRLAAGGAGRGARELSGSALPPLGRPVRRNRRGAARGLAQRARGDVLGAP